MSLERLTHNVSVLTLTCRAGQSTLPAFFTHNNRPCSPRVDQWQAEGAAAARPGLNCVQRSSEQRDVGLRRGLTGAQIPLLQLG